MKKLFFTVIFGLYLSCLLPAQSHISVPVDDPIYYILEQGQLRGILGPMPAVKPYSRQKVLEAIDDILAWDESELKKPSKAFLKLSDEERTILAAAREKYSLNTKPGFSLRGGGYHFEKKTKSGFRVAGDTGVNVETFNSVGGQSGLFGTDTWFSCFIDGDLGDHFSYDFNFLYGILLASRGEAEKGWAFDNDHRPQGYTIAPPSVLDPLLPQEGAYDAGSPFNIQHQVGAYRQPGAFFPYTYRRGWDGFLFALGEEVTASSMINWPGTPSAGTAIIAELSGDAFDGVLSFRFARMRREWGSMTGGSSLIFNGSARPFVALETTFNPADWFAFSTLTGALEYYNEEGIGKSAWTFQNLFSIEQFEFNAGNFFHLDIGSSVVYTKRLELGYIFPLTDNFMYQNNVGDFDNMGLFFDLAFQYPGLGGIWFSAFADEIEASSITKAFTLDRNMFALQAGARIIVPFFPFTTIIMSYTKIEPYCYTHLRTRVPYFNDTYEEEKAPMETSYTNNGTGLGYYLPPNSDEFKVRLETRPFSGAAFNLQYQLIRHGAEYGSGQVPGSSFQSELWASGRSSIPKDFLNDGAYEWTNVIKLGAAYSFMKLPLKVFCETGFVSTKFEDRRTGRSTEEYGELFNFIFSFGLKYSIR